MRKRIQKLALGQFEHEEPVLTFSTDKIEIAVSEGQDYTGDFVIESQNGVSIKGLVYSSNPHMECLTPQFKGEEITIRYQFHSEGFVEGDIQKGEFFIICNQGEYNLSFVASVCRHYADSSTGRIKTLYDFAKLAGQDYEEAFRLFTSAGFHYLFQENEKMERLYYEAFSMPPVSMTNMEEFLVTIHKKEAVRFSLKDMRYEFCDITANLQESVEVRKNHWGFLEINVASEDAFLVPEKEKLTVGDFVGSICHAKYRIDAGKLHAGKNFGKLIFENSYQREEVEIVAIKGRAAETPRDYLKIQRARKELTGLYIDYRLKKIGNAMWALESIGHLNQLLLLDGGKNWYKLMKAQAYLVSGQKQEAEWILTEYKREANDKTTPEYGYYLYLCTLHEREPSYVNRLAGEIEEIYRRHEESDLLFWVRLFVRKEYCEDAALKLRVIEQRVAEGSSSPFLFLEAYYVFWQNPYLLTKLKGFEIKVLHWAAKKDMLTGDLAVNIVGLAGSVRTYRPLLYRVLTSFYEKYKLTELLSAICSYLVRSQRFAPKYHSWYELGIEEDLRITGLNEAYLMSMDLSNTKKLPRMVQMYFRYNTSVPYKQKAALLVNIIAGKDKEPSVYQSYHKVMEEFAIEQIMEEHMDDNLAVIYGEMLERGMIEKSMVSALSKILYTHKLTVFSGASAVYVIHRQLKDIQVVPVVRGVAYFQLYSKDYVIVLEDTTGRKYAAGMSYQLERLLNPGMYLRKCLEYTPYELPFLLHYFSGREKSTMFMPEEKEYLIRFFENEGLRESYRAKLYPEVIRFLERIGERELAEPYLRQAPIRLCTREARTYLMEELIEYREYDKAYEYIREYGVGQLSAAKLVSLCSHEIEAYEMEEDDFLINLTSYVFLNGKYNNVVLTYLEKYYGGTTKSLKRLWRACNAFEVDSFELEERLLVQMLYTTEFVDNVEEIYESYCAHGGITLVREAYLSYFSYIYLVKQTVVPNHIFPEIMQRIGEGKVVPDVCRLALLNYFAEEGDWFEDKIKIAIGLLEEYVKPGMYFAFYQKFPDKIKRYFQIYDKIFIEYRTSSKRRVLLHYRTDDDELFAAEEMPEVFEGIYVKAFTIFFGESIEYYIIEDGDDGQKIVESEQIIGNEAGGRGEGDRYELLNTMLFVRALGDSERLERLMVSYERQERKNKLLFRII